MVVFNNWLAKFLIMWQSQAGTSQPEHTITSTSDPKAGLWGGCVLQDWWNSQRRARAGPESDTPAHRLLHCWRHHMDGHVRTHTHTYTLHTPLPPSQPFSALRSGNQGASLVAQWLRICLPMQGTRVRALVWEDPTCRGATGPVSHSYWACASEACAPQQERPRWWGARAPRWRVVPTCRN